MYKKIMSMIVGVGVASSFCFANANTDFEKKLLDFQNKKITNFAKNNADLEFKNISIYGKSSLGGVDAYFYKINFVDKKGEIVIIPDVIYSNGQYVFEKVIDIENVKDLTPDFAKGLDLKGEPSDEYLIHGDGSGKRDIVIFSDPLCPACIQAVPMVLNAHKENKDVNIYYYTYLINKSNPYSVGLANIIDYITKSKAIGWDDVLLNKDTAALRSVYAIRDRVSKKIGIDIPNSVIDNIDFKSSQMVKDNFILGTPTFFLDKKRVDLDTILKGAKGEKEI